MLIVVYIDFIMLSELCTQKPNIFMNCSISENENLDMEKMEKPKDGIISVSTESHQ